MPVSDASLAVAYRQLGLLLESGHGLTEALRLLLRHTRGKLRDALGTVRARVERGATLGDALGDEPAVFPESARGLVVAGEAGGGLPAVFAELAASCELRLATRRRIIRACIYPFVLLAASFFVLPLSKLITDGVVGYLKASLLPFAVTLGALFAAAWLVRRYGGPVLRHLPLAKARMRLAFARHLGAGLRAGLDTYTSLALAARATGDAAFAARIDEAAARVRTGTTLEAALAPTGLFDDEFLLAVAGGEASGRLDTSLEQQARLAQDSVLHKLEVTVQVTAIAILLGVYAFVGWRTYQEYKKVLGGNPEEMEKLMKELDPGAGPNALPPELQ